MSPALPSAPAPAHAALYYVMGVNLIIWAGLFLYLLYIDRKVRSARATSSGEDRP